MTAEPTTKKPRGFAAIDPERRREISSSGGKAAHVKGTAHQFSTAEARAAGSKGGSAPHRVRGRNKSKEPLEPAPEAPSAEPAEA